MQYLLTEEEYEGMVSKEKFYEKGMQLKYVRDVIARHINSLGKGAWCLDSEDYCCDECALVDRTENTIIPNNMEAPPSMVSGFICVRKREFSK